MMVSVLVAIYLLWFKPLETPLMTKIEFMNESTVILLTYGAFCFTDFLP